MLGWFVRMVRLIAGSAGGGSRNDSTQFWSAAVEGHVPAPVARFFVFLWSPSAGKFSREPKIRANVANTTRGIPYGQFWLSMAPDIISISSTPRAISVSSSVIVSDKRQTARPNTAAEVINISSTPLSNPGLSSSSFPGSSSPLSPASASEEYHSSVQARSASSPTPDRKYRDAASLPFELKEHCLIYLEEGLCT